MQRCGWPVLALAILAPLSNRSFAQDSDEAIRLLSPPDGASFGVCSCYDPPVFRWETSASFKTIEVQFSVNDFAKILVKLRVKPELGAAAVKPSTWRKILLLHRLRGGILQWKVVGTNADKSRIPSGVFSLELEEPEPAGNAAIEIPEAGAAPQISWETRCNQKFKVWFGSDRSFTRKKAISAAVKNPLIETRKRISLKASTWAAIGKLAGAGDAGVCWCVESLDTLRRTTRTRVLRFVPPPALKIERYDVGFFSIRKPKGWEVFTAGYCSTFAFLIQDPSRPLRRIFYFGQIGPVYTDQSAKDFDTWYTSQGYLEIPYVDAPVVFPPTAESFFAHWPEVAAMKAAEAFMPRFPRLDGLEIISVAPQPGYLPLPGADSALVRGIFAEGGATGEGQFFGTMVPLPFSGLAQAYIVLGATAPKEEFSMLLPTLVACLESFTLTDAYINWCFVQQQQIWEGVAEIGRTLSEASDIIYDAWVQRSAADDILAQKRSDAMLGFDRVYDPDTGTVYKVPAGWYEDFYEPMRDTMDMHGLQLVPGDDPYYWMSAPLGSFDEIH